MLTVLTNIRSTKVLWLMEETLWWKMTFCGGRPLVEDDLRWKKTFSGRRPSVEDDLWWKTHLVEEDLWWKTTFSGRQPLLDPCILPAPLHGIFFHNSCSQLFFTTYVHN